MEMSPQNREKNSEQVSEETTLDQTIRGARDNSSASSMDGRVDRQEGEEEVLIAMGEMIVEQLVVDTSRESRKCNASDDTIVFEFEDEGETEDKALDNLIEVSNQY